MTAKASDWSSTFTALKTDGIFPERVHRLFLYGPPGTGKSAAAQFTFGAERVERLTLHTGLQPDDLIGSYMLQGKDGATETVWCDGPAVRAMRRGLILVLDELDQHGEDVRCALHGIMDDRAQARITLPTGETVTPADGFGVIGTSNNSPAVLSEALLDRIELCLLCSTPAPGILDALPNDCAGVVRRTYADRAGEMDAWLPSMSIRRMQAFARLAKTWTREDAARLVFGGAGPDVLTMLGAHAAPAS